MRQWMFAVPMLAALAGYPIAATYAADAPAAAKDADEKDVTVKIEDCPKAVRETIKKTVGDGKIEEIVKETETGVTLYEVDATIDGKDYELKIAEDGKLVAKKLEQEDHDGDHKDDKGEK